MAAVRFLSVLSFLERPGQRATPSKWVLCAELSASSPLVYGELGPWWSPAPAVLCRHHPGRSCPWPALPLRAAVGSLLALGDLRDCPSCELDGPSAQALPMGALWVRDLPEGLEADTRCWVSD